MQLLAIGATSATFFLIVGQLKLLSTALLTKALLGRDQTPAQCRPRGSSLRVF